MVFVRGVPVTTVYSRVTSIPGGNEALTDDDGDMEAETEALGEILALALAEGLIDADGDIEADSEALGEILALALAEGLIDADGDIDALALADGLTLAEGLIDAEGLGIAFPNAK